MLMAGLFFFFHLSMLSLSRDVLFLWIQIWVLGLYRTLEVVQISFQQLNGFRVWQSVRRLWYFSEQGVALDGRC